jgi:SSS family transporter
MHAVDWLVVGAYLVWVVYDGLKRTRGSDELQGYFLANRSLPWWAVGLSVMATQLSAITLVGTTGQGYRDGLRFVQFYFGLPIAMLILSVTVVPFFHRANVYTAYEYLEQRFDAKTRALTSLLFLLSRGLSCGVIIAAPAVILSIVLGWNLTVTVLAIGLPTALYTMLGGVQAVTWTDVKQMAVIVAGVAAALTVLVLGLPDGVSVTDALHLAGSTGRMQALDFRITLTETYTFWSGLIGGLFLMLSYFGCDQSQVQRYLTAKSPREGRHSLMMSAYVKIPFQAVILLTGILVFTFYLFTRPPMLFNPQHERAVRASSEAPAYAALESRFSQAFDARQRAALAVEDARRRQDAAAASAGTAAFKAADATLAAVREQAVALVKRVSGNAQYNLHDDDPVSVALLLPLALELIDAADLGRRRRLRRAERLLLHRRLLRQGLLLRLDLLRPGATGELLGWRLGLLLRWRRLRRRLRLLLRRRRLRRRLGLLLRRRRLRRRLGLLLRRRRLRRRLGLLLRRRRLCRRLDLLLRRRRRFRRLHLFLRRRRRLRRLHLLLRRRRRFRRLHLLLRRRRRLRRLHLFLRRRRRLRRLHLFLRRRRRFRRLDLLLRRRRLRWLDLLLRRWCLRRRGLRRRCLLLGVFLLRDDHPACAVVEGAHDLRQCNRGNDRGGEQYASVFHKCVCERRSQFRQISLLLNFQQHFNR